MPHIIDTGTRAQCLLTTLTKANALTTLLTTNHYTTPSPEQALLLSPIDEAVRHISYHFLCQLFLLILVFVIFSANAALRGTAEEDNCDGDSTSDA